MENLVNLEFYRRRRRKEYLRKYKSHLENFVGHFVNTNVDMDFRRIAVDYQTHYGDNMSWDYIDLREIIREAFVETFAKLIDNELQKERWYDSQFLNLEEVIDRCVSAHIINQCDYAILSV